VRRAPALAFLFALLSVSLLYRANRESLVWKRTLIRVTVVQFFGLSVLTFTIIGVARAATGELTIAVARIDWRLVGDMFLHAQVGLALVLVVWRYTSDRPKHAQALRPVLAQANASGKRLLAAALQANADGVFKEALEAHRGAVKALGDALPDQDAPAHPWERTLLAQLKDKAGRAGEMLARTSLSVRADIRADESLRNLIASWPGLGHE
jgi:hypothetical protein